MEYLMQAGHSLGAVAFIAIAFYAFHHLTSVPEQSASMMAKNIPGSMHIVIVGGGVIGCTSAYFLTRHPKYDPNLHTITILEATEVASGSSGKAGGMLATYAEPQCLASLSFKLHAELAKEHDGAERWGHQFLPCAEFRAVGQDQNGSALLNHGGEADNQTFGAVYPADLDWFIPESIKSYREVGDARNSGLVHPYYFTTSMLKLAEEKGAKLINGTVIELNYLGDGETVSSVRYKPKNAATEQVIQATTVLIAAGPWTPNIFPKAPVGGARSHSVVLRPSRPVSKYALWPDIEPGPHGVPKKAISPEIYSRSDGTVYSCGPTDLSKPLPSTSDKVIVEEQSCQDILDAIGSISKELNDGTLLVKQACYRPVIMRDGKILREEDPLLGHTGIGGLLMAAGHASWGIQNAPATGKVVSELIFDGVSNSADISSLDPRRFWDTTGSR